MATCGWSGELSSEVIAEAVLWRRHLHKYPELAFQEQHTADFVASQLSRFGLAVHRGLAGTGVVGTLRRGTSGRAIAIRADMDALPVKEHSGVSYASCREGIMHACGHDGHMAMVLAAARVCSNLTDLDGVVHFVFQPAEEAEGGGRRMVEEGLFHHFPCDSVYALHNWPGLPLGTCVARDGVMMAALAIFEIEVRGAGGHAAMPHASTDPMVAACQIVSALQSVVSRNVDPLKAAVVSVTQVHAGDAWNAIPDACIIRGSARWFEEQTGEIIERRLRTLSTTIAAAFDCHARVQYTRRFPSTVNDPASASFVRSVATEAPLNFTLADVPPSMASEDFAFMLQVKRGCYFWLGAGGSSSDRGLHSSGYDFNDELLSLGAAFWVSLVRAHLALQ